MMLTRALLRRAVRALCEVAHIKAILSHAADPVEKEDTPEWKDAKAIDALLREPTPPTIDTDIDPGPTM